MEKIEFEKLEWMLNKPFDKSKNDQQSSSAAARFDFSGKLRRADEDVSVRAGLHHHGNDPDAPGYTLDELFTLARSKFNQQRVLALQTLGNILTRCHEGAYCDEIKSSNDTEEDDLDDSNNLLNQLVDGGLVFLLRWSLDDSTESIVSASLGAIRCLLQPPGQEDALDRRFDRDRAPISFSLHPFGVYFSDENNNSKQRPLQVDSRLQVNEKRELAELKDDEYVRQDLVGGLMRMSLIERMRYLIGPYQPQLAYRQLTHDMFLVLFRLVWHSAEFCAQFWLKYKQFVDLLCEKFLPAFCKCK